jgi:mannose-6-phosphate isomerase-like protein (cupin superfamily)
MSYPEARYLGENGEASAVVRPATAAPDIDRAANSAAYLATGASTGGKFGLYRWDFKGPETGPGPHFHRTLSESFFIISGTVRVHDGRDWRDTTAGDFMYVPEGGVHGFRNESGEPASMLILFSPGAPREEYFENVADAALMSDEERLEFYLRHDNHWVS